MSFLGTLVGGAIKYATPGKLGETLANNISDPTKDIHGNTRFVAVPATGGYAANEINSGGTGPVTGGSYGAGGAGYNATAQYDQSIGNLQSAIDRLGNQQNIGNQNIDTSYNSSLNDLTQGKARSEQTYNNNVVGAKQDYGVAKNSINANTGSSLTSLLRLLGAHGAGGSSAALVNAPQAAARQATLQRTDAGQTYGKNAQALDSNWNNYLTDWNTNRTSLDNQKRDQQNSLTAKIDQTRASLLQSLATLVGQKASATGGSPVAASQQYLDQANGLLGQVDNLGLQTPVFQVNPSTYQAPDLASYTTNPNAAPVMGNDGAATDYANPYLSLLLNKKNQQNVAGL